MTSKKLSSKVLSADFELVKTVADIEEYRLLSNGLSVLYQNRPDTGVTTTNITYRVGSRDEARGETGLAHMLEHMLFKPTKKDLQKKIDLGGAMQFERETGCVLNANTWKDRTTYYFSYPTKYLSQALAIEADRMAGVILSDETLAPEQNNVLSEFDMYNGDPNFALSVQMNNVAFHSHSYGHETIGFREDIEDYTAEKLERFYRNYYRPDNATLMIVGDVDKVVALNEVARLFGKIKNPTTAIPRFNIREPKQEGVRRVSVVRESTINILSLGFKHVGFPSKDWFVCNIMLDVLAGGPESILHKLLVDTGEASVVSASIEPASESCLATININLAGTSAKHDLVEEKVLNTILSLDTKAITALVTKAKARFLTDELFSRSQSLSITQDLTEYASAQKWELYAKTPEILKSITVKQVYDLLRDSFKRDNLTVGYFIGR